MQVAAKKRRNYVETQAPSSRLGTWKARLTAHFGRQIHALQLEQQEREFFATTRGRNFDWISAEEIVVYRDSLEKN